MKFATIVGAVIALLACQPAAAVTVMGTSQSGSYLNGIGVGQGYGAGLYEISYIADAPISAIIELYIERRLHILDAKSGTQISTHGSGDTTHSFITDAESVWSHVFRVDDPFSVHYSNNEIWRYSFSVKPTVYISNYTGGPVNYTISLAYIQAVPEPAAWAMMIAGFGLAGMTLRRRQGFAL